MQDSPLRKDGIVTKNPNALSRSAQEKAAKRIRLNAAQKRRLFRILAAAVLAIPAVLLIELLSRGRLVSLLLILPSYLLVGFDVLWAAIRDIGHGQVFGEKFLMGIATIGALALGEVIEAVAVMIFFQVGELFESVATANARKSLSALASLCPDEAVVLRGDEELTLPIDEVAVGEITVVPAGARVPLDGEIVFGDANVDYSSLTGESAPLWRKTGDTIPSGVIPLDSRLLVRTTHTSENASTARILSLMEEALSKKGKHERFITRFSLFYTPLVVLAALFVAFGMPLFAAGSYTAALPVYLHRALTFLVISCPCALVISVPLAFFGAAGAAARKGIVFKSNEALETLASVKTAFFDKTGTLTEGSFRITEVVLAENSPVSSQEELLEYAAAAESASTHPLARAIASAHSFDKSALSSVTEMRGRGIRAHYRGKEVTVGSGAFLAAGEPDNEKRENTAVHVALDGRPAGTIFLSDCLKAAARPLFDDLRALGVESVILSGDRVPAVEAAGRALNADRVKGGLLPEDKVEAVKEASARGVTLFAGDGINDAPVLAAAGVGFAMGGIGSDAAIEAADAVVTDDNPAKVAFTIRLSRFSLRIVKENIAFALIVKFAVLILGFFGYASMWLAIFADVGVSVLAILNAIRTLRFSGASYDSPAPDAVLRTERTKGILDEPEQESE